MIDMKRAICHPERSEGSRYRESLAISRFFAALRMTVIALVFVTTLIARGDEKFRAPAIPLITHDPYFSIWEMSDRLTDDWPKHWTGATQALCGMVRIDGKSYRFLGPKPDGVSVDALEQKSLKIWPTRTVATFAAPGVELEVTFCSPLLPNDLTTFARPVSYVFVGQRNADGKPHTVEVYLDVSAEIAVNSPDQTVDGAREDAYQQAVPCAAGGDPMLLSLGSSDQPVLKRGGDGVRIDWGRAYLSGEYASHTALGNAVDLRRQFVTDGTLPPSRTVKGQVVQQGWPVMAMTRTIMGFKDPSIPDKTFFLVGYDEDYAVEYLGQKLRPYWRKETDNFSDVIFKAYSYNEQVLEGCIKFDESLMADLKAAGGEQYAQLAALCYREAMAGHGLALSSDGRPLMFAKENSSNGCIGTVDVIYPAAPIFLLLSPKLVEANLAPVLEYAELPRWKWSFAPHDLGTYPHANGQVYGGGERTEENQMPVEESANLILLVAGLEKGLQGPTKLAENHRALLKKWADYLLVKGLDPERQLCTDDFSGHLAHNVNLSVKAILGIAAYGQICETHGDHAEATRYLDEAKQMAKKWVAMAKDGDHTKLAFDKPGTWSQKYNLVWDRVLGLNLFPPEIARNEIAFYKTKLNKYGLPLDNRATFTKVDWTVWTACLSDNQADFAALVNPTVRFANETPDRVPMTDWYQTDTGHAMSFRARPVAGGVFMKMLCDEKMWHKWIDASKSN